MSKNTKAPKKHKRGKRGMGRLYKRLNGKEYPADSPVKAPYYLAYSIEGKRESQALRDSSGEPVTDRKRAESERLRIMAPLQTGNRVNTLKDIQSHLRDAEEEHAQAVEQSKSPGIGIVASWAAFIDSQERPDSGDATLRQYGFQWQRFVDWITKEHPDADDLQHVTREMAREYATDLTNAGLAAGTFNKHVRLLSLVFRVLADQGQIGTNPWEKIRRKKAAQDSRRELTSEELRRICEAADDELRMLLALGIYTGLRLGDCATLRWDEVDLPRGFIVRVPNKTRSTGKPVQVPLHRDLAAMLADTRKSAKTRAVYLLPAAANEYNRGGSDSLTRRIQRLFWTCGIDCHRAGTGMKIARDEEGIPVQNDKGNVKLTSDPSGKRAVLQVGFHSLRHSFVSLCRESNAPLSVVESIVGHSNPAMTRLYSHTSEAAAVKAIAALPSLTGGNAEPTKEPAPQWVIEIAEGLNSRNWKQVKAELLKGAAA